LPTRTPEFRNRRQPVVCPRHQGVGPVECNGSSLCSPGAAARSGVQRRQGAAGLSRRPMIDESRVVVSSHSSHATSSSRHQRIAGVSSAFGPWRPAKPFPSSTTAACEIRLALDVHVLPRRSAKRLGSWSRRGDAFTELSVGIVMLLTRGSVCIEHRSRRSLRAARIFPPEP